MTPEESGYAALLAHFPPVDFAFAYGSGAVQQIGYAYDVTSKELPMIDVIFAVTDPIQVCGLKTFDALVLFFCNDCAYLHDVCVYVVAYRKY